MKIIKCKTLIDGTGNKPLHDIALIINGDSISEICSLNELSTLAQNESAEIIDASAHFVMPGLIDSHVHLAFSAANDPAGDLNQDTEEHLMIRQIRNAQTALRAGITMVRDCGSRGMSLLALRDAVNTGFIQASRIFASGIPITSTGGHCHFLYGETDSEEEIVKMVRRLSRDGSDFIKVMLSGGNMTPGSSPNITQYTLKEIITLVEHSHELGKTVAAHVLNKKSIQIAVQAGIDTLEHCAFLSANGTPDFDPESIDTAIKKGLYISPAINYGTVKGYVPGHKEELSDPKIQNKVRFWHELTETRFSTTKIMVQMGAKIIAGTDAGTKLTKFEDYWKILKVLNQRCGMNTMQVIESATRIPAEAMGIRDHFGTLEKGKKADLLILRKDPLQDLKNLTEIERIMLDGNLVVR